MAGVECCLVLVCWLGGFLFGLFCWVSGGKGGVGFFVEDYFSILLPQ